MVPAVVTAAIVLFAAIHAGRSFLPREWDELILVYFAFIPARFEANFFPYPGGVAAKVWTFFTYALLHGNLVHLVTNCVWLVAFGSAVAKRFGVTRTLALTCAASAGGALVHLFAHFGEPIPVVGASAGIAGLMAAASRFVFDRGGPIGARRGGPGAYNRPARSLAATFANPSAVSFIAIFFGINVALGFTSNVTGGLAIAWEAHIGGFLVGLLAFKLFDPVPR